MALVTGLGLAAFVTGLGLALCGSSSSVSTPTTSTAPSSQVTSPAPAKLPSLSVGDSPAGKNAAVLVPVTDGRGSKVLRGFTLHGPKSTVYIQYVCSGGGSIEVTGYFKASTCVNTGTILTDTFPNQPGRKIKVRVVAPSSVHWKLLITTRE
jgi:hypothetical protein